MPIRLILAQVMDVLEGGRSTMNIKFKRKILANATTSARIRMPVNDLLCYLSAPNGATSIAESFAVHIVLIWGILLMPC